MNVNKLELKVRELRRVQGIIEEAKAEEEALKNEIKAAMGDRDTILAGEYCITWKEVTTTRLDTTALKKALPDLVKRFSTTVTTRRFVVA